jgi:sodium/proline symporter
MLDKILVSLLYLSVLILFAVRARKKNRDIEDYYAGGRNVATLLVGLSFFATFVSTNSFVGHSAKSYTYGVSWLLVGAVLVLLAILSWLVIAPRFNEVAGRLGSVVPSDLFRLHFASPAAGAVAASIILFDSLFFLAAVFLSAAESVGAMLGIPFAFALAVVFVVQLGYTAVGGYLADVWSDSIQAVILLAGAIVIPLAMIGHAGGWSATWAHLKQIDEARAGSDFSLLRVTAAAPLLMIIGVGLSGGLKLVADPRQLSRFYGLRSGGSARGGAWIIGALVAVTYLFLLPIGLLSRALGVPPEVAERSDAIVPWLLGDAQILGTAAGTVILAALLAAAMSTIDSVLLVAAGAMQRDLLPLVAGGRRPETVAAARRIVLLCALLALVVAAFARAYPAIGFGIVELTVFAGALYAAAFLPGLIGILYWRGSTATGAIGGMIAGLVATAAWRLVIIPAAPALTDVPEVFVGVLAGTAAFVAGSIRTRPQS